MYNAPRASVLIFLPVLMLSLYMWGYFRPAYIRRSDVSVPVGSGRYRVWQFFFTYRPPPSAVNMSVTYQCFWFWL